MVIGGGKVAARKVASLCDAHAIVTVVSPVLSDELAARARAGVIAWIPRIFDDADITDAFLVFAATNDKTVNAQVLAACRRAHVPCCCADANWHAGDFLTPAVFRRDTLTVAVATGGQSCRRSRSVRDNLARHVDMLDTTNLLVIGTDHSRLELTHREPFHLLEPQRHQVGRMLAQIRGVHEFMLLNTCNRIEVLAAVSLADDVCEVIQRILRFDQLHPDQFYVVRDYDAFEHTGLVLAGLLSQAPGEHHIVAQVKDALATAVAGGWAGAVMQEWIAAAQHVAKALRRSNDARSRAVEIEDVCLDYIAAHGPPLSKRDCLVIGAGVVGAGIVARWLEQGGSCVWCYHTTEPTLRDAWRDRVSVAPLSALPARLRHADLVICAASGSDHVLRNEHAPCFDHSRRVLLMDLAMPRGIAPTLATMSDKLSVVDLDDLKRWHQHTFITLPTIVQTSRRIIEDHRTLYDRIVKSF
jgi:glutamyl-tRNA reductase